MLILEQRQQFKFKENHGTGNLDSIEVQKIYINTRFLIEPFQGFNFINNMNKYYKVL
jgi:hypothetical protein